MKAQAHRRSLPTVTSAQLARMARCAARCRVRRQSRASRVSGRLSQRSVAPDLAFLGAQAEQVQGMPQSTALVKEAAAAEEEGGADELQLHFTRRHDGSAAQREAAAQEGSLRPARAQRLRKDDTAAIHHE